MIEETRTQNEVAVSTSYTYDAVGNRLTETSGGTTTTYSYNDLDQLLSDGEASTDNPLIFLS